MLITFKRCTTTAQYLVIILLLAGCCVVTEGKDKTIHHLIIGIGVVSVKETPSPSVVVTDSKAIGINISDRPGLKLGIGYSSSTVLTIPDNATDVRVEISGEPGGPLLIDVLKPDSETQGSEKGDRNDEKFK